MTKNEILTALNKPDDWFLALVAVDDVASEPCYVSRPFGNEPYFGAVSVNYDIGELETRNC